ncbi:hypothetical protein [Pseudomonas farris]
MSGVFVKYAAQNPKKNSRDREAPLISSASAALPMIAWPDRGFQKKINIRIESFRSKHGALPWLNYLSNKKKT